MSDDEADPELLELLRQSLGISSHREDGEISSDTGVLKDAEYIYNGSIDVFIDMYGTRAAAKSIHAAMRKRGYSTQTWSEHPLHPRVGEDFTDVEMVNFIFTMDLLNFSFWSEKSEIERFQVEYRDQRWTGYNSLVACLRRALDEGLPVTTPRFWIDERCTDDVLRRVFRSATDELMPFLEQRIAILREAGEILHEASESYSATLDSSTDSFSQRGQDAQVESDQDLKEGYMPAAQQNQQHGGDNTAVATGASGDNFNNDSANEIKQDEDDGSELIISNNSSSDHEQTVMKNITNLAPDTSVMRMVEQANYSAGKLVNILASRFPAFQDETTFDGKKVRLLKRAQIFAADLWAAFQGQGYGMFDDIGHLTMFADYRVPQMLQSLGVLTYSPPLENRIRLRQRIEPEDSWEVQLRGCSIWAVELIRREIVRQHPEEDETTVNAVLIDFFLYDLAKEREASGASWGHVGGLAWWGEDHLCFPGCVCGLQAWWALEVLGRPWTREADMLKQAVDQCRRII